MERRVTGFHQDGEGHWVAELECGHNQHVRHDPPWECRTWVLTPRASGRAPNWPSQPITTPTRQQLCATATARSAWWP